MTLNNKAINALRREEAICELAIKQLLQDCTVFEEKYGLDTTDFLKKFEGGEIGDEADFFKWYALAQGLEEWRSTQVALRELAK